MKNILPCIVGLGYVGLPIFSRVQKKFQTIGYDINFKKIKELKKGIDITNTLNKNFKLKNKSYFTSYSSDIKNSNFYIITVPTPVYKNNIPNLEHIIQATKVIAKNLKKKDIIFYESTVYPGTTKNICIPILEKISKLKSNVDFFVGYSPERINPGDKRHSVDKIKKIIAIENFHIKDKVLKVYKRISNHLVFNQNIEEAETSKVIENIQRDLNIALINEIYKVCRKLNINFKNVMSLASTKWNFIRFSPGLVGGHCLPVDPYYFSYIAKKNKINTKVILAGRSVNNDMKQFVIKDIKNILNQNKISLKEKILFLGATYKKNVPDIRNSLSLDIFYKIRKIYKKSYLSDPLVAHYFINKPFFLKRINNLNSFKLLIIMVDHDIFKPLINKFKNSLKIKLVKVLS
jgi:UDP-N-acetyl-D-galactosamine dehydrogenase